MSMHLERIRVTERSKRKPSNRRSLAEAKQQHAKFLQSMGLTDVSTRAAKRRSVGASTESYIRTGVPTSDRICADAGKKQNTYTGSLIQGIATMHKSNSIPIINKEQAVEVSQMRRN